MVDLIPYFLSFIITLIVGMFSFSRRHVTGARAFTLILLIELIQTIGYVFELKSSSLIGKTFWDNFQWFTSLISAVALVFFAYEYIGKLKPIVYRWIAILFCVSILLGVIISVDLFPGLGVVTPQLIPATPFSIYTYGFGPVLDIASIFIYGLFIFGMSILITALFRQNKIFRKQTMIIIVGLIIPMLDGLFVVFGIDLLPNRDTLPFAFAIANLILVFGLFRYRIFDVVPIARSMAMDYINDPVFILNDHDIILEVNPAVEAFLKTKKNELINKSIKRFLPSLPLLEKKILSSIVNEECLLNNGEELGYYEINSTQFSDRLGVYAGRLLVFHNLTSRKLIEDHLFANNDVLEERIRTRTLELLQLNEILKLEVDTRRKAEHEKSTYAYEMETLFNLALEISELSDDIDVEGFLASRVKELNQAFFVLLANYDPVQKQLSPRHIVIDEMHLAEAINILGSDPRTLSLPVDEETYKKITNEVVRYRQNLSDSMYGVIDPNIGEVIQNNFDLHQFIGIAIQSKGRLAASMVIALQKNTDVPSKKFYESLANLASVVFWRK